MDEQKRDRNSRKNKADQTRRPEGRDRHEGGDPFDEEYAAEVAPQPYAAQDERSADKNGVLDNERDRAGNPTLGWIALALSIAALFLFPAVLGTAGVIVGFIAYMQGNRALGVWSIAIGALAFISYFALAPFYT